MVASIANLILIITGRTADADKLKRLLLERAEDGPFVVEQVGTLEAALERLHTDGVDLILVDLFLPDSQGIATFDKVFGTAAPIPIVTLAYDENTDLAREAVQRGAQGFLLKGHFENELVPQRLRNTIERKLVEDSLFEEKERTSVTLDSIADAVISTDRAGIITYMNVAAARLTGWARGNATGHPVEDVLNLIDATTRETVINPIAKAIRERRPCELSANCILIRSDLQEVAIEDSTAPIYDRRKRVTGAVMVFRNTGPTQSAMAQQMVYQAHHDALTGLPNRMLLNDRIATSITRADRNKGSFSVFFLDLDNFKNINDSLGHSLGDELLKSVARALKKCMRASDSICRYGGDEFVVLCDDHSGPENTTQIAVKIISALALPHAVLQHEFHTTVSIGISTYPADGQDSETLIKNADIAMYRAKRSGGGGRYWFFDKSMNQDADERHAVETDLRRALSDEEFVLYYQPKVNLKSGVITGVEALIRWQHPQRGLVPPGQFINIAEESGLILPIGLWVLEEGCRQAKTWSDAGLGTVSMAVNVSALQFRSKNFIEDVKLILNKTGLNPQLLELEMTEGLLMSSSDYTKEVLRKLKDIGVQLSIDDFGTGFSSLNYLQEFPIDVLKIDQSFVNGITETEGKRIIVTAVIGMGKNLRYKVIAEGIETKEQFEFLKSEGCEDGQGYLFSRPVPAAECTRLLKYGIQLECLKAE